MLAKAAAPADLVCSVFQNADIMGACILTCVGGENLMRCVKLFAMVGRGAFEKILLPALERCTTIHITITDFLQVGASILRFRDRSGHKTYMQRLLSSMRSCPMHLDIRQCNSCRKAGMDPPCPRCTKPKKKLSRTLSSGHHPTTSRCCCAAFYSFVLKHITSPGMHASSTSCIIYKISISKVEGRSEVGKTLMKMAQEFGRCHRDVEVLDISGYTMSVRDILLYDVIKSFKPRKVHIDGVHSMCMQVSVCYYVTASLAGNDRLTELELCDLDWNRYKLITLPESQIKEVREMTIRALCNLSKMESLELLSLTLSKFGKRLAALEDSVTSFLHLLSVLYRTGMWTDCFLKLRSICLQFPENVFKV